MQYAAEPEGAVNVIDRRWPGAPLASPGFWGWPRVDGQGVAGSPH
jgi:hypothetical protein